MHKKQTQQNRILKTLANTTRLQLIQCLASGRKNVTQLVETCRLSQSAVSQHLAKLRKTGLVRSKKEGKEVFYSLTSSQTAKVSQTLINFIKEKQK